MRKATATEMLPRATFQIRGDPSSVAPRAPLARACPAATAAGATACRHVARASGGRDGISGDPSDARTITWFYDQVFLHEGGEIQNITDFGGRIWRNVEWSKMRSRSPPPKEHAVSEVE